MNTRDVWKLIMGEDAETLSAADILNRTSYDELFEIHLKSGHYRILNHVDDKYLAVTREGDFRQLHAFAMEHYVHPEDAEAYFDFLNLDTVPLRLRASSISGARAGSFRFRTVDGGWVWTRQLLVDGPELGKAEGLVYCFVFDTQKQVQRIMGIEPAPSRTGDGRREEITGLLEGVDFFRPIQRKLSELSRGWCVVDVDVEHYKLFSDWYGLASAQYLLTQMAEILQKTADEMGGMAGYLGQDQFCLVIPYDMDRIQALYDELQALISSVSAIDGFAPIFGIALIDGSGSQIMEYYNHAALTAEEISRKPGRHIGLYDVKLHQKNSMEYRLFYEFRNAIEKGEITFWLQPQYRVSSRKIVGAEALARWTKADGSRVSPAVFVPILEKYNLVTKLDVFIWESICRWLRSWIDRGRTPVPVSVNISQLDLFALDVPDCFEGLLKKYELSPEYLKLELTESAYVDDTGSVRSAVSRLQKLGFMVLMDDFGSGYSSLNMLRNIEVDVIKLDAQFLRIDAEEEQKGISILESIVNMTRNLATPIIVEGVETLDQVRFLSDMGCRYMQGFYFSAAMPVEQFEEMIGDPNAIDTGGIVFKANQQLQIREFLDQNIYSDVMLNNILGPVAFYYWHGKDVDIIRFNEQFYQMVGIEAKVLEERRHSFQNYIHPGDREKLYELLRYAEEHHAIGARGVIRAYRPNGVVLWLALQLYFIGTDGQGKKFYASVHDVTERQFISSELPGAYYRCTLEEDFKFLFISQNFIQLTGFSKAEIQLQFDNKLINMVHPADRARVMEQADAMAAGRLDRFRPYRLRRKVGDYIYVTEQSKLTDHYGAICWQAVVIDVNEVMRIRNQMRILSKHFTDTILFLRRIGPDLEYEVAVHGLENRLGIGAGEFRRMLNGGEFCKLIEGSKDIPHKEYTQLFVSSIVGTEREISVNLPDGRRLRLAARADRVEDEKTSIEYIIVLRQAE